MVRAGSFGPSPSRSRHQEGIKGFDSIWENACEKGSKEPAKLGEPDSGDSERGGEKGGEKEAGREVRKERGEEGGEEKGEVRGRGEGGGRRKREEEEK